MSELRLPTLVCPFPPELSTFAAELEERCLRWGPGHGLAAGAGGQRWLRTARFGALTARVCAGFEHDRLIDVVDWLVWLFAFDDEYCEQAGREAGSTALTGTLVRFLGVMAHPAERYDEPYARALADVWQRTTARASDGQRQRLLASVQGYFFSLVWEACHLGEGVSLAEYRLMRPHTAGVPLWLMLVEIFGGHRPPDDELAAPAAIELQESSAHTINWMNDIQSFPRERALGPHALNLPTILAAELHLSPQQALVRAAEMYAAEITRYLEIETTVLATASSRMRAYVLSLRTVLSGFHRWFTDSGRYG